MVTNILYKTSVLCSIIVISMCGCGSRLLVSQPSEWKQIRTVKMVDRTAPSLIHKGADFVSEQFALELENKGYVVCQGQKCAGDAIAYVQTVLYDDQISFMEDRNQSMSEAIIGNLSKVAFKFTLVRLKGKLTMIDTSMSGRRAIPIEELVKMGVVKIVGDMPMAYK